MYGKIDRRNKLNDLTGKEWLKLTKSFWLSEKCVDDKDAFKHPAPFLIKDIMKLIGLFTKKGMVVLDPFCGSGTTLIAANNLQRVGIGVDLNQKYKQLAKSRLRKKHFIENKDYYYKIGDANDVLETLEKVDYIVTSPPYHNILKNKGGGLRTANSKGFRTGSRIGIEYYSDNSNDLGNKKSYSEFLSSFQEIMSKCFSVLNQGKYASIIISDFTVSKEEICVQKDIVDCMLKCGFDFVGTTVLLQDNKPLYPFGYPYAYKINHMHQNIINFMKPKKSKI
ncbi:MAG: methyltransferase domain-containing protein [Endomicrobium sp.]|jgi:DNA modification methylase|nr:methyltransferase domain-containing protein [Endomicrobium sp.]